MKCEYCKDEVVIKEFEICECEDIAIAMDGSKHKLIINLTGDVDADLFIDIKFCPFCSRQLTKFKPLTLDKLKEKSTNCKPTKEHMRIWFQSLYVNENAYNDPSGYMIILPPMECEDGAMFNFGTSLHGSCMSGHEREYGKTWLAYDREPEISFEGVN